MGAETGAQLKRLEFVPEYVGKASETAVKVYDTAKAYVPATLQPTVESVEGKAVELSTPYVKTVQAQGEKLLFLADDKVDELIVAANTALEKQKAFHAQNLEHYKAAREAYLKKIEETVEFVKDKGLAGTAKYAADGVLATVAQAKKIPEFVGAEAQQVMENVKSAWEKFVTLPPVSKVLENTTATIDFAWNKYSKAHDAVVASPTYKKAYDSALSWINYVQGLSLYKTASTRLYPWVAPYADPAIEYVTTTSYYQTVLDQLKPADGAVAVQ